MASVVWKSVDSDQRAAGASTTINVEGSAYSVPTGTKAKMRLNFANSEAETNYTFTVFLLESGGTERELINARTVPGGKTDTCPELQNVTLKAGDSVKALSSTADKLNLSGEVKEWTA
tara:strand:- start:1864 stop:2217 length:354 start_codon:yes stop_codon:yes gene_type:complete